MRQPKLLYSFWLKSSSSARPTATSSLSSLIWFNSLHKLLLHSIWLAFLFAKFNFPLCSTNKSIFHILHSRSFFLLFSTLVRLIERREHVMLSRRPCHLRVFCFVFFLHFFNLIFYLYFPFCGGSSPVWHRAYSFRGDWIVGMSRVELNQTMCRSLCVCVFDGTRALVFL